jgi:hypothetical protein
LPKPAAQNRHRAPACFQRCAVRDRIDTQRAAADNRQPSLAQVAREPLGDHAPIRARLARAHHTDGEAVALLQCAPHQQRGRDVGQPDQRARKVGVGLQHQTRLARLQRRGNLYRLAGDALNRDDIRLAHARNFTQRVRRRTQDALRVAEPLQQRTHLARRKVQAQQLQPRAQLLSAHGRSTNSHSRFLK